MRLQRFIAQCTSYSRRKAEELISKGFVKVNGKVISTPGTTVNPDSDLVVLKGKKLRLADEFIYVMLHKPAGYISTRTDTHGRKTIMNLIPYKNIFPVGRLDKDTEGLILLTDDGDLAFKLTHPKFEHEKEYFIKLKEPISTSQINKIEKGVKIDGKLTSPCKISNIKDKECNIVLHEGRKRQIRRMFEEVGNKVIYLKRIRIGNLKLGNLKKGKFKLIKKHDLKFS